ncbi:MAG: hypothetical protein HQ547_00950 [Candidatus Omnitrophica bacterium]|nr:hypothetical protein [Candidatus Omnitrophota bacterium]
MTPDRTVAIIVPIYAERLTPDEEVSFRHLMRHLSEYDKYLIMPDNLHIKHEGFSSKEFNKKYFQGRGTYNQLLVSKFFYKTFIKYEYILIYHLDSLVFSDQLIEWCKKGYDYIGAPWFKSEVKRAVNWDLAYDWVGNGGFSLRKVQTFLKVLDAYQAPLNICRKKIEFFQTLLKHARRFYGKMLNPKVCRNGLPSESKKTLKALWWDLSEEYIDRRRNEDSFWSFEAKKLYPDFKIAPVEIAVSFSFETGPRYCFEKNNHCLPFGCHGWTQYDREFWQPYLLK